MEKIFTLVIYDIVDTKLRNKLVKYLSSYGTRVQKSAFEARLTKKEFDRMLKGIPGYVTKNDKLKVYRFYGENQVYSYGSNVIIEDEDNVVI